jgi:asparagine synthase (glutamine-hydrolysing)
MCGITGVIAFNNEGEAYSGRINAAVSSLSKRGPDAEGICLFKDGGLGHTRLSIIDVSEASAQPFTDASGRYTIVLNGEFFNYKEHRKDLELKGVQFNSSGDTEVLLQLYIREGANCLQKVNGFFSFAVFDREEETLFLARDRMGIKPLLYYKDGDKFIFASEMKALMAYGIPKKIDQASLLNYLQLNYIPAPHAIFEGVKKVLPGTYMTLGKGALTTSRYYDIPKSENSPAPTYDQACINLKSLLEKSVELRLVSDVPLGAFLSGGIDSSVLVAIASKRVQNLKTFSIGYKDAPHFDETHYANLVAKKCRTDHTVFSLTNEDLYENLHEVLEYIDEPFADSSALAVFILSKETRKHVKVALSGDGADELFAGYNKHHAAFRIQQGGLGLSLLKWSRPLWNLLPKSRNSVVGNTLRQLSKFSHGLHLSERERYWLWAGIADEETALASLSKMSPAQLEIYRERKDRQLKYIEDRPDMNNFLRNDMNLVLQNDMLTKVDLMSMANGLEVRTPFLDYRVVDFAFSLPASYKIDAGMRKKVLKDAFKPDLPEELYSRKKQGFEVPLLEWFKTELKSLINDDLLGDTFIEQQGIFNVESIRGLKAKLFSNNVEDAVGRIWGLIVFQYWWKKYML